MQYTHLPTKFVYSVYCTMKKKNHRFAAQVFIRLTSYRRSTFAILMLLVLPLIGTAGYMLTEGWNVFDALYMTTITIATIGYGEIHPLTQGGRAFTIIFIFFSVVISAFAFATLAEVVFRPEMLSQRILQRTIRRMHDHYIICGYGKSGSRIASELEQLGKLFVIIEQDEPKIRHGVIAKSGMPYLIGDAATEEMLEQAGIHRAAGLVTTLDNDAANVFVVLTAHDLNPTLHIVARADQTSAQTKLLRAGANAVLSPYEIGSVRMTHQLLRHNVVDSFELVTRTMAVDITFIELPLHDYPTFVGKTIPALALRERYNMMVIAIKRHDEQVEFPPSTQTVLESSMTLIVAASDHDIMRFHQTT